MLWIMKYVMDTKNLALQIKPSEEESKDWSIIVYSDSDWAADRND